MNRQPNQQPNPCDGGTDCKCPSGKYYVSCMDSHDTSKFWLMAGPYPTHREAEAEKRHAQNVAEDADPRAFWKAWGITRMQDTYTKPGKLNELGLLPQSGQVVSEASWKLTA